ncbi:CCA tRNA nucleotidyltransferase [Pirellulaceae bacterium SH449]
MRKLHWEDESDLYRFSAEVVRTLQSNGFIAYFAGGCVRDALMGNMPSDYDVATNATLDQVQAIFGSKYTKLIGAAFGVACVWGRIEKKRFEVEVATFRCDGSYSDGRRPDWVRFSSPEEDAQRRDFSINGIFYDPVAEALHDFVGGEEDLRRGIIRAIGDPEKRIEEDKLRMLRAVRFAARFGFEIDSATFAAVRAHANEIAIVSGERIAAEFRKLVQASHLVYGLQKIFDTGLMQYLLPEVHHAWNDPSVMNRALKVVSAFGSSVSFESLLASLYWTAGCKHESGVASVGACKERWKLSNAEHDAVLFAIHALETIVGADQYPWSVVQPWLVSSHTEVAVALAEAWVVHDRLSTLGLERCLAALKLPREELDPPPLLTGNDLQKLGLSPGPAFARILKLLRAKQLDLEIVNSDDAKRWIQTGGYKEHLVP